MPPVYRVQYSNHDRNSGKTGDDPALLATALIDGDSEGRVVSGEYLALLTEDGIVPISHPLEFQIMEDQGQTFFGASLRGNYLHVVQRLCLQCGAVFDAPRVDFAFGPLPGLLVMAGIIGLAVAAGWSILTAVLAAIGFGLLAGRPIGWLCSVTVFRKRQGAIEVVRCPDCGGKAARSIAKLSGKSVRLKQGDCVVSVHTAGMT